MFTIKTGVARSALYCLNSLRAQNIAPISFVDAYFL